MTSWSITTKYKEPVIAIIGQANSGKTTFIRIVGVDQDYKNQVHSHFSQSNSELESDELKPMKLNLGQNQHVKLLEVRGVSDKMTDMSGLVKKMKKNQLLPTMTLIFLRSGRMETQIREVLKYNFSYLKLNKLNTRIILTHCEIKLNKIQDFLKEKLLPDAQPDVEVLKDMNLNDIPVIPVDFKNQDSVEILTAEIQKFIQIQWNNDLVELNGCNIQ
jgi:GTPase SAR1 family protein